MVQDSLRSLFDEIFKDQQGKFKMNKNEDQVDSEDYD